MNDETLQVVDIRALPVEEGSDHLVLAMVTAIQAPFVDQNSQPVVLPTKIYRVNMGKDAAQGLSQSLAEEADKLPEPKRPTNLVVPGSPADVDAVAQKLRQFGG